jgi:hypothetical protein
MSFPSIARVRQQVDSPEVENIESTVQEIVANSHIRERVPQGGRIAVGLGSRGIHCLARVARATIDALKQLGFRPFVVAAMGTHGGATADGQRQQLADRGITPESMGVEIRTDMETVELGTSPVGLPIYFDANAYAADGIVLINRVKPHTDFRGAHESGVLKMLVIGLGKRQGAEQIHKLGLRGMIEVLPAVGRILMQKTKFVLGVAIVENVREQPALIAGLEPENLLQLEPRLLEQARALMGRLPFDQIDVLIVGELGKNYSGAGMDPNVIGRLMIETQPDFARPVVTRLAVLDASPESHGNIVGVGFADLTTEKLVAQMNPQHFRVNILTSCFLERGRIPITLPTDLEVVRVAVETCWRIDPNEARMVIIPNTLELETLWISEALREDAGTTPGLLFETDFQPIPFTRNATLDQERLFPNSMRSLRHSGSH